MSRPTRPGPDPTQPFDREQGGGGSNWEILGAAQWNSGEDGSLSSVCTLYHGPQIFPILPFPLFSRKGPRLSHDL